MFSKPNYKAYAWTFVSGLVAGAILGLIYAPVTGKKMQKKVLDTVEDFGDKFKKMTA
jgi:hypothetical protein